MLSLSSVPNFEQSVEIYVLWEIAESFASVRAKEE